MRRVSCWNLLHNACTSRPKRCSWHATSIGAPLLPGLSCGGVWSGISRKARWPALMRDVPLGCDRLQRKLKRSCSKSLDTVLGTDGFKKLRNDPKFLQMNSARHGVYLGPLQRVRKSLEADKRCRLSILSLLRMPISPLRRRKQST